MTDLALIALKEHRSPVDDTRYDLRLTSPRLRA